MCLSCHSYVCLAWYYSDDLMSQLAMLLETKRNTSRIPGAVPVICVGHSLGGALATICALEIAHRFKTAISLQTYTFGCPRVGDRRFANEYDRRVPFTFRFVFDRYISSSLAITAVIGNAIWSHICVCDITVISWHQYQNSMDYTNMLD